MEKAMAFLFFFSTGKKNLQQMLAGWNPTNFMIKKVNTAVSLC